MIYEIEPADSPLEALCDPARTSRGLPQTAVRYWFRTYEIRAKRAAHRMLKGRRREGASKVAYEAVMREFEYEMRQWEMRVARKKERYGRVSRSKS